MIIAQPDVHTNTTRITTEKSSSNNANVRERVTDIKETGRQNDIRTTKQINIVLAGLRIILAS